MSTKIILWIVLGLAVAGGGTYVAVNGVPSMNNESGSATTTADASTGEGMSLKALLALKIPQQCTFTDVTAAAETSGTVYISGGKARGDFKATAGGKMYNAHSIFDAETMHSWVEETNMGVKVKMDGDTVVSNDQSFDASKTIDYKCSPWIPDATKFTVPTDITFIDASAMMNAGANAGSMPGSAGAGVSGSAGASVNACTACDAAPEAYRAQCKAAAGC